jgi:AcrR family transcriptional regulator
MVRDTRNQILEAVLGLLDEGDGDFTYERLAAKAGVARQTIYSQFPERTDLLVAAVDHARVKFGADELAASVYDAATGRDALAALLDFHLAYTPQIMRPSRIVEGLRARSSQLSARFEQRPSGRRQIVRHVMQRLAAEGDLRDDWSVDEATDLLSALMTASFTSDLLEERRWTEAQLRDRLRTVVERSILVT